MKTQATTTAPNDTQAELSIPRVLEPGQQVTFEGARYEPKIRIGSVLRREVVAGDKITDITFGILVSLRNQKMHGGSLIYSTQSPAVLCADYEGKAAAHAAASRAYAAAPVLTNGETVSIDGIEYLVRIVSNPNGAANPIAFKRKDGKSEIAEALKALHSAFTEENLIEKVNSLVAEKYGPNF